MNDDEITQLKDALEASEAVYWTGVNQFLECLSVIDEWREQYTNGEQAPPEPAVQLDGGTFAALYNCEPSDFVHVRNAIRQNT